MIPEIVGGALGALLIIVPVAVIFVIREKRRRF